MGVTTEDDEVAECTSASCWAVEEHGWDEVAPALPDEVSALVAPPVVVRAERHGAGH